MKRYRAAIVGCGRIGSLFSKDPMRKGIVTHADAYKNNPRISLVAACDIDKERLEEFGNTWKIKSLYTDIKTMMQKEKIDILSICTPPFAHYTVLKEAVKFPLKAIFCEKPLADDLSEGGKMVELCRKNGIILQVGHQRRFDQLHMSIMKLIRSKKLGMPQHVNFYYTAGIKNTGSHMFDILRFFFGDVEWIEALMSKNKLDRKEDVNLDGVMRFKDGTIATFQACDVKKYLMFELNCLMDKGRIIIKDSGFSLDFYKASKSKHFSGYSELFKAKSPFNTDYKRNFMVKAIKHILECIEGKSESRSSGIDGLAALELINAAIGSADSGGKRIFIK